MMSDSVVYSLTLMARAMVLAIMSPKIAYSKGCDVTNHHILYCILALGIYRLCGLAFRANSTINGFSRYQ